jgi:hypothetical protein
MNDRQIEAKTSVHVSDPRFRELSSDEVLPFTGTEEVLQGSLELVLAKPLGGGNPTLFANS